MRKMWFAYCFSQNSVTGASTHVKAVILEDYKSIEIAEGSQLYHLLCNWWLIVVSLFSYQILYFFFICMKKHKR